MIRRRRRSTISASAPAGNARATIERLSDAQVSATIREETTNEVMSHDSPTDCIMLPMFDTMAASQMPLNVLYFRGDNPEDEEAILPPL